MNSAVVAKVGAQVEDVSAALAPVAMRLDELYQEVLDKIEGQFADATSINESISEAISKGDAAGKPVLNWNPELAMSPKAAFKSFAEAMAKTAAPHLLSNAHQKSGYRYQDLIDWTTPPVKGNSTEADYQAAKMRYARSRSVRAFFDDLLIRFHPQSFPEHAIDRATSEIARIFSITTPIGTVIPVTSGEATAVFAYSMYRSDEEMVWHLAANHHAAIVKASNAIATVALLNNLNAAAASIGDMLNQLDAKMDKKMYHYESGDSFFGGNFLRVVLRRDIAEFQFGETMFKILDKEIRSHVSDVRLIFQ